jgi:hypothetical protein
MTPPSVLLLLRPWSVYWMLAGLALVGKLGVGTYVQVAFTVAPCHCQGVLGGGQADLGEQTGELVLPPSRRWR